MQSHDLRFYIREQKNAFKVYKLLKSRKRRMAKASASLFYLFDIFISFSHQLIKDTTAGRLFRYI